MLSDYAQSIFNFPNYLPSKGAAFGVAAVYYAMGVVLAVQSFRAKNFSPSRYAVLIALMLGGAFTARGVFIIQNFNNTSAYTAFSVLIAIAPNFINLVDYIVLIILLKGVSNPPSKRILMGIRVFAILMAVTFGAVSTAGTVLVTSDASAAKIETAVKLIKASVAGQLSVNFLFIVIASFLLLRYREALRHTRAVAIVYIGGLLLVARNSAKIVPSFYPQDSLMRDSEAAWYCLDPLFTLLIIFAWVVLDLPSRCSQKAADYVKEYNNIS
ncbi:hypothetical protein IW140_003435 [Coemansia sp. RSA 1813]|nr:hypothetical protein EV178_006121 [Coemansia sp. RSA 1646]KAJ1768564.1 hypothetical protein LPJ74_004764 [Coemansia sp. RSA 1843]KAJ2568929.1 hypothetical protein IW140_003435 [Coemansia sp. RSA 1813]